MTFVFSIHYFLWYGALTSIFGYESVYARYYIHATTMQYGYLNMVLLFITVIVTPVICSMADRQRAHRNYFVVSLITTAVAVAFYTLLPILLDSPRWDRRLLKLSVPLSPNTNSELHIGPWIYFIIIALMCDLSMGINTCLSDSFAVLQAEENDTSFGRIIVWGTFGWASSALVLSVINQFSLLPRLMPGLLFGSILLTIDIILVISWPRQEDFKLDNIPVETAQTLTGSAYSVHRDPSYLPNETMLINLGNQLDSQDGQMHRRTLSPMDMMLAKTHQTKSALDSQPTQATSDTTLKTPAKEDGLGSPFSSITTIHSDFDGPTSPGETGQKAKAETITTDAKSAGRAKSKTRTGERQEKQRRATSFRLQLIMLRLILRRRRQLIRYLVLFTLAGFFMSMHWNYFFLYLEEIFFAKFEFISALSMVGQSILGELPFFILSRKVIQVLGRSHTLSVSVISIGIRFLLYRYLLPGNNMYYIIIADCFQGPNYGLFYVVMTEISLEYSYCDDDTVAKLMALGEIDSNDRRQVDSIRLSLRSTIQSVAFACYEGLGVGIGSVCGGWIVASYGFKTLWLYMAICSISVGLLNLLIELTCRERDPEEERSERRTFMEARRKRLAKKMVAPHPIPQPGMVQASRPSPASSGSTARPPTQVAP